MVADKDDIVMVQNLVVDDLDRIIRPIPHDLPIKPRLTPEEVKKITMGFFGGDDDSDDDNSGPLDLLDDLMKSYEDLAKKAKEGDSAKRYDKDVDDNDYASGMPRAKKIIKRRGLVPKKPRKARLTDGRVIEVDDVEDTLPMGADIISDTIAPSTPPVDPYDEESPLEKMMKDKMEKGEVEEYVDEFGNKRYRTKKK